MPQFLKKFVTLYHISKRDLIVLVAPWKVKINTGYKCALKCPLCPTGAGDSPQKGDLTAESFKFLLNKLKKVKEVYLFGWGEPLLNKDIFEIISLAKKEGKYIAMDSCLSMASDDKLERLVKSGLDFFSVSLDGTDQDTYSKYRIGGDFNLVFGNMKKIQQIKKS
jgi:MoaA/NifB/PqqE/SkfB family radical SAM enzyme